MFYAPYQREANILLCASFISNGGVNTPKRICIAPDKYNSTRNLYEYNLDDEKYNFPYLKFCDMHQVALNGNLAQTKI